MAQVPCISRSLLTSMLLYSSSCILAHDCDITHTFHTHMYTSELNECSDLTLNDCDVNADCTDIPGSYKCNCRPGYTGNGTFCDSMVKCICVCYILIIVVYISDVDECQNDTLNDCDVNADCFDTEGSFNCTCRAGYTGTGIQCQGKQFTASAIL